MVYLLVNHVPFGLGSSAGRFVVGDLFLQDLRAQQRAIHAVGGKLVVATPCVKRLDPQAAGSFNTIEISPAELGFEYVPLPRYISMKQYLLVQRELRRRLRGAVQKATIVQMDDGGYPVMLGQEAWRIASRLGKRRIWVFDGADPFPRLALQAARQKSPSTRMALGLAAQRKI